MYMSGPFIQHEPYAPGTELFRWGVKGPDDARAKVQLADGGVDVIKLIDRDQMTIDEVQAVVDEAHRRGKPVVAHAHRPEEIRRGWRPASTASNTPDLASSPEYPEDIIALLRERTANMARGPLSGRRRSKGSSTTSKSATTRSISMIRRGRTACPRTSSRTSSDRSSTPGRCRIFRPRRPVVRRFPEVQAARGVEASRCSSAPTAASR